MAPTEGHDVGVVLQELQAREVVMGALLVDNCQHFFRQEAALRGIIRSLALRVARQSQCSGA
jgi:hypothetical protein